MTEHYSRNMKHRPKARERQTEARACWRRTWPTVYELVGLSREDQTHTYIARYPERRGYNIAQSNVVPIIHRDVGPKCFFSFTKTSVCYYR